MRAWEILNEMIVRAGTPRDGAYVIAHAGYIWISDYDDDDADMLADIAKATGVEGKTIGDIADAVWDGRPDILVGLIHNKRLLLNSDNMRYHPASSPLVRKLVQALGLDGIALERNRHDGDTYEVDYTRDKLIGDIPQVVYHGTSTKYIRAILRKGIMPTSNANWAEIGKFHGKVFLTVDRATAAFHANRQAEKHYAAPVIIATRLPDRSRIGLDYDVAVSFHGPGAETDREGYTAAATRHFDASYERERIDAIRRYSGKTDWTKATGIFSYSGRIPPSFFVSFETTLSDEEKIGKEGECFIFTNARDFLAALDMYEDFGFYDPDYEPEADEDEWDDEDR